MLGVHFSLVPLCVSDLGCDISSVFLFRNIYIEICYLIVYVEINCISQFFFFFARTLLILVFHSFRPVVFNKERFCPLRNSWQCLETFLVVAAGDSVYAMGIQWAETREAAEHPTMHRVAPPPNRKC